MGIYPNYHREAKTKSAMALLIHRVEILKPQSNCRNRRFHSLTRASLSGTRLHRPPPRPVAPAAEEAG